MLYGVIVDRRGEGENVLYITLAGSNCTIVGFNVLISLLFSNIFSEFFFFNRPDMTKYWEDINSDSGICLYF
jgi:hypothetical protein